MKSKFLLAVTLFILAGQALLAATPTITSFNPAQGPVGTLVTVAGTNLGSPTAFSIGGVTAVVVSNSGTRLVGLVMPGAVTGFVSLTTSGGTAKSANKFTVTPTSYPAVQQGSPLAGTGGAGQPYQGNAVAISADGNTAVVGGYNDNNNQGAGWFYTRTGGTWTQQGAKVIGTGVTGNFGAYFGSSVAISADGNTAIFGGPDDNLNAGATWVFTRSGGVWTQQGNKLVGSGATGTTGAQQGEAVALSADGNTALVGGNHDSNYVGATWVFTRSGSTWTQVGSKLVGSGALGNSFQGRSVAISADGKTAMIGAPGDNGAGATWVFTLSGGVWTQQGNKQVGSGSVGADGFGYPVALSADGNTAIIGGTGDASPLGAAWVFTRSAGTWSQQGNKLVGTGGSGSGYGSTEGSAVAISADGNTAIIGGNTDGSNAGAIWVFTRSAGTWTQQGNKFKGTGGAVSSYAQQGSSAALSADGTTLIEGGPENNTNYGIAVVFTPTLPAVNTLAATSVTTTGATINGTASDNGIVANISMEYGTAPDLTGSKTTTTFSLGTTPLAAGSGITGFSSALTGLAPATVYYFRIDANNVNGTVYGNILSFTTSTAPLQPQTITFGQLAAVTYGATDFAPGATSTNTTIPITYASNNTAVATITAGGDIHIIGAGNALITASQAGNTSYSPATPVQRTLTVNQAPLTITAVNKTKQAGAANPALTATYSGFVYGESHTSLTQQPTVTTTATTTSAVGNYPITASGAVDPNYSISYVGGILTVTVSTNANLAGLAISHGTLAPAFAAATINYTASVANSVTSVKVTPTTADAFATVKVNGTAVASGTSSAAIPLNAGSNTISTIVTAEDGATTKTYTITVTRAPSSNARLSFLSLSQCVLSPAFVNSTTSYTSSVANTVISTKVTPVVADATATVTVNGTAVTSGTASAPITLNVGSNSITTIVTAQDGVTKMTYTVTVTRAASSNANLSKIVLSHGSLTPAFAAATMSYTASVANSATSITITPTTSDHSATVKVNGTLVTSGTASAAIPLNVGSNTITTIVTAADGVTKKTYTVTVTRPPSTNANLSKLGASIGGLTPAFSGSTTSYTISAGNATASMTLKPVSSDANATIKVNGTTVASGTTTAPIALAVGPNTVTTVVTAQNGTTTKTYTLTVTRASGGADSYVPIAIGTGISVTIPIAIGTAETPTLAEDGIQVHQGLSPNGDGINDYLQIDNISQYPDNKLMIMNRNGQLIYEASGYDNSSKVFDGHSNKNGRMQLPGTYFYQLDYTVNGVAKHKTGFLVLKY